MRDIWIRTYRTGIRWSGRDGLESSRPDKTWVDASASLIYDLRVLTGRVPCVAIESRGRHGLGVCMYGCTCIVAIVYEVLVVAVEYVFALCMYM